MVSDAAGEHRVQPGLGQRPAGLRRPAAPARAAPRPARPPRVTRSGASRASSAPNPTRVSSIRSDHRLVASSAGHRGQRGLDRLVRAGDGRSGRAPPPGRPAPGPRRRCRSTPARGTAPARRTGPGRAGRLAQRQPPDLAARSSPARARAAPGRRARSTGRGARRPGARRRSRRQPVLAGQRARQRPEPGVEQPGGSVAGAQPQRGFGARRVAGRGGQPRPNARCHSCSRRRLPSAGAPRRPAARPRPGRRAATARPARTARARPAAARTADGPVPTARAGLTWPGRCAPARRAASACRPAGLRRVRRARWRSCRAGPRPPARLRAGRPAGTDLDARAVRVARHVQHPAGPDQARDGQLRPVRLHPVLVEPVDLAVAAAVAEVLLGDLPQALVVAAGGG